MELSEIVLETVISCLVVAFVVSLLLSFRMKTVAAALRTEADALRRELTEITERQTESLSSRQGEIATLQSQQLYHVTTANEERMNRLESKVSEHLEKIREDNNTRLKEMRMTVEEQLQSNLDKKLGESFKQVSERLEQVYRGLGEMQTLAVGVGDLKKVLTNIKTRGTWGEVQLGNLLEQILAPEQYAANVITKAGSNMRVEYAVKMPGKTDRQKGIWLPIDAKFPMEAYQLLLQMQEEANQPGILLRRTNWNRKLKRSENDPR